jgi:hypothetical protein
LNVLFINGRVNLYGHDDGYDDDDHVHFHDDDCDFSEYDYDYDCGFPFFYAN